MPKVSYREDHLGFDARWHSEGEGKSVWVWIYGTQGWREWLLHLVTMQLGFGRRVLGTAFWAVISALKSKEGVVMWRQLLRAKHVHIQGHSLGGAHAQLLGAWVRDLNPRADVAVEVYGTKLVGNRLFVRAISGFTIAYRHRGDVVPLLGKLRGLAAPPTHLVGRVRWPWQAHSRSAYKQWGLKG